MLSVEHEYRTVLMSVLQNRFIPQLWSCTFLLCDWIPRCVIVFCVVTTFFITSLILYFVIVVCELRFVGSISFSLYFFSLGRELSGARKKKHAKFFLFPVLGILQGLLKGKKGSVSGNVLEKENTRFPLF